jgi:hypothetical protein
MEATESSLCDRDRAAAADLACGSAGRIIQLGLNIRQSSLRPRIFTECHVIPPDST